MNCVKDYFDRLSATWDQQNHCQYEAIAHIIRLLDLRAGDNVLDVGCGTGILLPFLYPEIGPTGDITALDLSSEMLAHARRKYAGHRNISFVCADIEKTTPVGRFQHIIMYNMLPHLHHPIEAVKKLVATSLVAGGNLTIAHHPGRDFINAIHSHHTVHSCPLPAATTLAAALDLPITHLEDTPTHYILQLENV